MNRLTLAGWATVACSFLVACGNGGVEEPEKNAVAQNKERPADVIQTPAGAPFTIRYSVIGTPVVGSPVTLDLQIVSAMGSRPVEISYEIPDPSSMMLSLTPVKSLSASALPSYLNERVVCI